MKKFKKLGLFLGSIAVGVMLMAPAVNAQEQDWFSDVRDSYTQNVYEVKFNYTDQQYSDLLKTCQVNEPKEMYLDDDIKKMANQQKIANRKVYDLRFLTEFGLYNLKCGKNKAFNYGIVSTDNLKNPSSIVIFCKCSDKDFADYMNFVGKNFYKYSDYTNSYVHSSDGAEWDLVYDSPTNLLRLAIDF